MDCVIPRFLPAREGFLTLPEHRSRRVARNRGVAFILYSSRALAYYYKTIAANERSIAHKYRFVELGDSSIITENSCPDAPAIRRAV